MIYRVDVSCELRILIIHLIGFSKVNQTLLMNPGRSDDFSFSKIKTFSFT